MNKRLYKSGRDRVLCGVCGGIAEYFDVDPVIIRLLTVLFAFTGSGIVFYIIAAVIMSEAPGYTGRAAGTGYAHRAPESDYSETYDPGTDKGDYPQNERQPDRQKKRRGGVLIFGLVLMILGLLTLFGIFFPFHFVFNYKLIFAVVLLALGLYFVVKF